MTVHMSLPTSGVGLVRSRITTAAALVGIAALSTVAAASPAIAASHPAARALACRASVSDVFPTDGNSTVVQVKTVAGARVTTAAHYETTTTTQSAKANRSGLVAITYYIGGATKGYPVLVTVKVQSGSRSGSCRTAYLPV